MFCKDNLIYDAKLFYKTNPIFKSQLIFLFYKISFLSLNKFIVYI